MPVYTEAKIRKLFKELAITDNGVFELDETERLTPAAKGFLNDHHVTIRRQKFSQKQVKAKSHSPKAISCLEDSAVYPLLFRLTKLYPYLFKGQKALHGAFHLEHISRLEAILTILEKVVSGLLLDDILDYQVEGITSTDLELIGLDKARDKKVLAVSLQSPDWQLSCYQAYVELRVLRQELELALANSSDIFTCRLLRLLALLEDLLWLIVNG